MAMTNKPTSIAVDTPSSSSARESLNIKADQPASQMSARSGGESDVVISVMLRKDLDGYLKGLTEQ